MQNEQKSAICECAFSRVKGVKDFSCLINSEFDLLLDILKKMDFTKINLNKPMIDIYPELIKYFHCDQASDGVDQCVKDNLEKEYPNFSQNLNSVFQNALPIELTADKFTEWLSTNQIQLALQQLGYNYPHFQDNGIAIYSDFEEGLENRGPLSITSIIQQLKTSPKTVFGWVLNVCHNYSNGQHWVALGMIKQSDKITVLYYDSQCQTGPQTGIIDCDFKQNQCPPDEQAKYQQNGQPAYKSKFTDWWNKLLSEGQQQGLIIYPKTGPLHNTFITQTDDYSCGFHAIYFMYLIANQKENAIQKLSQIASQIQATSPDVSSKKKAIDKYIHDFQTEVFKYKKQNIPKGTDLKQNPVVDNVVNLNQK